MCKPKQKPLNDLSRSLTPFDHTYALKSGGITCNMSTNKELGHEAAGQ